MDQVPTSEVKKRTKKITNVFNSYLPYENRIGKQYSVLVTETSTDRVFYVGHNEFYEHVLVPKRDEYLGKIIDVEIKSSGKFFMVGKPLNEPDNQLIKSLSSVKFKLSAITCCTAIGLIAFCYFKFKKM